MRSGQEPACDSGTYAQSRAANAMLSFFMCKRAGHGIDGRFGRVVLTHIFSPDVQR